MYGFMLFIKVSVYLIFALIKVVTLIHAVVSKSVILLVFAHKCFVYADSVSFFTGKGQWFAVLCHHYTRHA